MTMTMVLESLSPPPSSSSLPSAPAASSSAAGAAVDWDSCGFAASGAGLSAGPAPDPGLPLPPEPAGVLCPSWAVVAGGDIEAAEGLPPLGVVSLGWVAGGLGVDVSVSGGGLVCLAVVSVAFVGFVGCAFFGTHCWFFFLNPLAQVSQYPSPSLHDAQLSVEQHIKFKAQWPLWHAASFVHVFPSGTWLALTHFMLSFVNPFRTSHASHKPSYVPHLRQPSPWPAAQQYVLQAPLLHSLAESHLFPIGLLPVLVAAVVVAGFFVANVGRTHAPSFAPPFMA